jgi:hypothetical protein
MRGGANEPLSRAELEQKFLANARLGGWSEAQATNALDLITHLWRARRVELGALR